MSWSNRSSNILNISRNIARASCAEYRTVVFLHRPNQMGCAAPIDRRRGAVCCLERRSRVFSHLSAPMSFGAVGSLPGCSIFAPSPVLSICGVADRYTSRLQIPPPTSSWLLPAMTTVAALASHVWLLGRSIPAKATPACVCCRPLVLRTIQKDRRFSLCFHVQD